MTYPPPQILNDYYRQCPGEAYKNLRRRLPAAAEAALSQVPRLPVESAHGHY